MRYIMKTFIFSTTRKDTRKGGFKVTARVFRAKSNQPIFIGETWWNTASCRGDESEVMNFLIEEKEVPKRDYGYYYNARGNFRIFGV